MTRGIQLDRDCADLCRLAASLMARGSEFVTQACKLCSEVCQASADECSKHKDSKHLSELCRG